MGKENNWHHKLIHEVYPPVAFKRIGYAKGLAIEKQENERGCFRGITATAYILYENEEVRHLTLSYEINKQIILEKDFAAWAEHVTNDIMTMVRNENVFIFDSAKSAVLVKLSNVFEKEWQAIRELMKDE